MALVLKDTNTKVTTKKRSNFLFIMALMVGYTMVYMDKSMISTAIIPIAEQFDFTTSQTGLMMSLFFLGYSIMQIPSGWLADRIGYKKVLIFSLLLVSIFTFAFGFSGSLFMFVVIRFFSGLGHAGYPPGVSKGIASSLPKEKRTFVQSLILSTSGIGGFFAFIFGARLIEMDWHYAYFMLGTLFIISLILVILFVPNIQLKKEEKEGQNTKFLSIIMNRKVWTLFVAMMFVNIAFSGIMSWIPSFLKTEYQLSISTVGTILSINAILGGIASLSTGMLLTKIFLGKEKLLLASGSFLAFILFIFIIFSKSLVGSITLLYILTFLTTIMFVGIFSWPHKLLPEKVIGSAIGIINTGGTMGGFIAPVTFGALISYYGSYSLVFGCMAAASMICGIIILTVKK